MCLTKISYVSYYSFLMHTKFHTHLIILGLILIIQCIHWPSLM